MRYRTDWMAETFRYLAVLLERRLPLGEALAQTARLAGRDGSTRLSGLVRGVTEGGTLAESMDEQSLAWPLQYRRLIAYGEKNGVLPDALLAAADLACYERTVRAKRMMAMAYPVLGVAVAAICLFTLAGGAAWIGSSASICSPGDWPLRYRWLVGAGRCILPLWPLWVVLISTGAAFYLFFSYRRYDRADSKQRLCGGRKAVAWMDHALTARIAGRLARRDVPLEEALQIAALAVSNPETGQALRCLAEQLERGVPVVEAAGIGHQLDALLVEALQQEKSVLCDDLFGLAELYSMRAQEAVAENIARIGLSAFVIFALCVGVVVDFFVCFYSSFIKGIGG